MPQNHHLAMDAGREAGLDELVGGCVSYAVVVGGWFNESNVHMPAFVPGNA
jgi:hypothetical protein